MGSLSRLSKGLQKMAQLLKLKKQFLQRHWDRQLETKMGCSLKVNKVVLELERFKENNDFMIEEIS